ncbi:MAG: AI-2E family transporter [Gammaproteobacteria bacterium]|nr:AI-2E family transporter [Gammaproteobacteria bacterium]
MNDESRSPPTAASPLTPQPARPNPVGMLAVGLFLALLLLLGYRVLRDFLVPLVWAAILVYTTWPLYRRLHGWLGGRDNLSAALMAALVATALFIPLVAITALLGEELASAYRAAQAWLAQGPTLPAALADIPWLGERLQALLELLASDPAGLRDWLTAQGPQWLDEVRGILGAVGRNVFKLGITLLALFFLFRDGERIISETRLVLQRFLGDRVEGYWQAVTATTRGVVYGLVLTALAQGALAGLGYWVAGLDTPVLLGALTAVLALIPFGAPVVWGSAGIWLVATGALWPGLGLLLWGALVISMIDNLIRPIAISSAARVPFFLVLLGVFGGLRAFGLVGLFLGPIVLTVMLAVWREWLEERVLTRDA